jgi:hypothetical protein
MLATVSKNDTAHGPATVGCVVDISRQQSAEDFHQRKTEEAIEMERHQERFIDVTSHKMRNPWSASFQCAGIIVSLLDQSGNFQYTKAPMVQRLMASSETWRL